jgi:hypothetical protein
LRGKEISLPYVPKGDACERIEVKEVDRTSILRTGEGLAGNEEDWDMWTVI